MGAPNTTGGAWAINDRIKGGYYKVGSSAGLIAIVGNGFNIGSAKNDAHQMAASGALYDALEALVSAFRAHTDWSGKDAAEVMEADAVLALARGES